MDEKNSLNLFKIGRLILVFLLSYAGFVMFLLILADIDELKAPGYSAEPLVEKLIYIAKDIYIPVIVILILLVALFLGRKSPLLVGELLLVTWVIVAILSAIDIGLAPPSESSDGTLLLCLSLFFVPLFLSGISHLSSGLIRRGSGLSANISTFSKVSPAGYPQVHAKPKIVLKADYRTRLLLLFGTAIILAGICLGISLAPQGSSQSSPDSSPIAEWISITIVVIGVLVSGSGVRRILKMTKEAGIPMAATQESDLNAQVGIPESHNLPENMTASTFPSSQESLKPLRLDPRQIFFLTVGVFLLLTTILFAIVIIYLSNYAP